MIDVSAAYESPGRVEAGWRPARRRLRRPALRAGYPVLLASGSRVRTRCARFARSARTCGRESEERSALRAPPPTLRCPAPQKSPRRAPPRLDESRLGVRRARTHHRIAMARACAREIFQAHGARADGAACKGAGAVPPARLCAAEKRSSAGARAKRASCPLSRRMFERSERSSRSEFRRASRRCEHRRAPPAERGAARPRAGGTAPAPLPAEASRARPSE